MRPWASSILRLSKGRRFSHIALAGRCWAAPNLEPGEAALAGATLLLRGHLKLLAAAQRGHALPCHPVATGAMLRMLGSSCCLFAGSGLPDQLPLAPLLLSRCGGQGRPKTSKQEVPHSPCSFARSYAIMLSGWRHSRLKTISEVRARMKGFEKLLNRTRVLARQWYDNGALRGMHTRRPRAQMHFPSSQVLVLAPHWGSVLTTT